MTILIVNFGNTVEKEHLMTEQPLASMATNSSRNVCQGPWFSQED